MTGSRGPLVVPPPVAARDVAMDDGAIVRVRRHGRIDGPRLVLSHGNGCAIDGYLPYWRLLLDDFDLVLFDFRNHGRNPPHGGAHGFDRFLRDLDAIYDAIDREFGRKPQVGAFHSMSARANIRYALEVAWRFEGLVAFDPSMVPPEGHALHDFMVGGERVLWRWAETRQEAFDDPAELAGHFAASRMLSGWVEGAHDLMARSVLRRDEGTGGWRLSCPGALEARIYRENAAYRAWPRARELPGPVALVASDPDGDIPSFPGHGARALRDERGWRCAHVPGAGHFLQIQAPEACRDLTTAFLREIGFA